MKICAVGGCENKVQAKGYCNMHYMRLRRHGSVGSAKSQRTDRTKHPLYSTWQGMRQRCNDPKSSNYGRYGARGVTVCKEWDDFAQFASDMGARPDGYTLDRIDNAKGYSKDNCRWCTMSAQMINRRVQHRSKSGVTGVSWYKKYKKWAAYITRGSVRKTLGYFDTIEEAAAARQEAELHY